MDSIALAAYKLAKNGVPGPQGKPGTNGQDGTNGIDGLTPYIGLNGNWFIGDEDTGVKAAGDNGGTPTITATEVSGGVKITITNANGGKYEFTIFDGDKGEKGDSYTLTEVDKAEIAALCKDLIDDGNGVAY